MGTTGVGVMFGCVAPERTFHMGAASPLRRWEEDADAEISAYAERNGIDTLTARARYVPATTWASAPGGDAGAVLGFWVATPRGDDYCAALDGEVVDFAVLKRVDPYRTAYRRAQRGWRRFARWCANEGVALPEGRLMLAPVEEG